MKKNTDITIALTSCWRFNLLKKTICSLGTLIDLSWYQKIITEDSINPSYLKKIKKEHIHGRLKDWNIIYTGVEYIKDPYISHQRALEVLYDEIQTPYAFHCEDDRIFEDQSSTWSETFLDISLDILSTKKDVGIVCVRNIYQVTENNLWLSNDTIEVLWIEKKWLIYAWREFHILKQYDSKSNHYTLNPWLRRTQETKKLLDLHHGKQVDEYAMWVEYKKMWLHSIIFAEPIARHIW